MSRYAIPLAALALAAYEALAGCGAPPPGTLPAGVVFTPVEGAPVALSATELDFGDVPPTAGHGRQVFIQNTSSGPLELVGAKATCPCIKSRLDDAALPPGGHVPLDIRLELAKYPKNTVKGSVLVKVSRPGRDHVIQIPVHAQIQPEYAVQPDKLALGEVKRGRTVSAEITLTQTGRQPVTLESVETPAAITAECRETPGEPAKTYAIHVEFTAPDHVSSYQERIALLTNVERIPRHEILVTARVVGIQCTVAPRVVVFGPAKPGAEAGRITIENPLPFTVAKAEPSTPAMQARIQDPQPATRHTVTLVLSSRAPAGELPGRVTLTLEEPGANGQPPLTGTREIAFYGTVVNE